jgi:hypothetical protein
VKARKELKLTPTPKTQLNILVIHQA